MYVSAKEKVGPWETVQVVLHTGEIVETAYAADTDQGWFERIAKDPETGRFIIEKQCLVAERITDQPFYLVDKDTGQVIE